MTNTELRIPATIATWPTDQRAQWLADELWGMATGTEDPAPAQFVRELLACAALL